MGILTNETEKLTEAHASRRGETPDALVRRLPDPPPRHEEIDWVAVDAIVAEMAKLPVLDDRPLKELRESLWE